MSITTEQAPERDEATDSSACANAAHGSEASAHQPGGESIHEGSEPPQNSPAQPQPSDASVPGVPARTTSTAQVEANRRNAKKSTGPRSAEGKRRSAMNALTHGAYGRAQAIPRGLLCESEFEVKEYVDAIVDALAPRDAIELVIARRIATADLRLARLERYEGVAMAKVGRLRPDLGEALPYEVEMALSYSSAARRASQFLRHQDEVSVDLETWRTIANVVWDMHDTPEKERLVPDIPDDHEDAVAVWAQFVVNDLINPIWHAVAPACAALDAQADMWAGFFVEYDGKAEERAVSNALAKGGPIDSASVLRARVQREGYRDRATYAELHERVLADEDDEQDWTDVEAC
jgi:hypothetical protein